MRLGIDIGGTKIEAAALGADGAVLRRQRLPTPAGDYAGIIATIRTLVEDAEAALGRADSVGLGIPGMLAPATGLVKNANSTCLIGRPFDRDLAAALGRPVRLANDANCFALSEAVDGAARGARVVFGVILGTGVGGGIVVDGRVLTGPNAIAGEWGHSPLPWPCDDERPGALCYCGKYGCTETFLSGAGLSRAYEASGGTPDEAVAIVARAESGEAAARAALDRYADRLARSLATVINLLDPEIIVLGGGLGQIQELYRAVPAKWGAYVFSDTVATKLVPPRWGDSSGVRGAAWLWSERQGEASWREPVC
ncbi:MAG TPA: ROK family protein [Stellaceae bacterium]|jgi:fructokinase|nr:ROK family protein [Stellaceae bacterium]